MDTLKRIENILQVDPDESDFAYLDTKLTDLQKELSKLTQGPDLETLEQSLQLLGTAVGKAQGWQLHFRTCGILSLALEVLSVDGSPVALRKQALRVVGNSVADNDTNRKLVTKVMQSIVPMLTEPQLSETALIVFFNLCHENDPAQEETANIRLDTSIARAFAAHKIALSALEYGSDIIAWTMAKLTPTQLKDLTSLSTFRDLLSFSSANEPDYSNDYTTHILTYLQDPDFQELIFSPEILDQLLTLLLHHEAHDSSSDPELVFKELATSQTGDTAPPELYLTHLVTAISNLSATDAFLTFARQDALSSPVIQRIRTRLTADTSIDHAPSTVALCVILGNLAMSEDVCETMVSDWHLHIPLIRILRNSTHSAFLYSALGLIRHLAMPELNRAVLGEAGLIDACARCLENTDDAAVRGEAAAVLRQTMANMLENVERIVTPRDAQEKTCLATLVSASLEPPTPLPSTRMKNLSIETGRTIVTILRCLARCGTNDAPDLRNKIFSNPRIALPLARLVRQHIYPDARAEGLLGLGLMAQSAEGAACVLAEMRDDDGVLDAIREVAEEKGGSGSGREYQNGMVLLQALGDNRGSGDDDGMKERIEEVKRELGRMMV